MGSLIFEEEAPLFAQKKRLKKTYKMEVRPPLRTEAPLLLLLQSKETCLYSLHIHLTHGVAVAVGFLYFFFFPFFLS